MNNMKFSTKILLVILGVSLFSMIIVSVISYKELLNLADYSKEVNMQLGDYTSDSTKNALLDQAKGYMYHLAVSKAADYNEMLVFMQYNTPYLSSYMIKDIMDMRINKNGYIFLINAEGYYLVHPYHNNVGKNSFYSADGSYKEILVNMAAGQTGVRDTYINGKSYFVAYAPIPVTRWSLGIAVECDEVTAEALTMQAYIDDQTFAAQERIRSMLYRARHRFIVLICVIAAVVVFLSIRVADSVTKPVLKLTNSVIEAGKGNLDAKIKINSKDEIGALADCFNKMTDDLKEYIANLSKITAEKERIGAELNVATNIQASMLPNIFPAFPERKEFDLYATMLPAKEVGGDFYDLFLINKDTLAVLIADVSGKGVPAALFMVIAKTLIKNNAQYGYSPKEVFEKVNNLLCANNNECMFVTAFMGYLNIHSGEFTCVNASHNPPLLLNGNGFEWINIKRGMMLGGIENVEYSEETMPLKSGDMIYLYTDGVTEALNPQEELYGEDRLMECAVRNIFSGLQEFVLSIKADIDAFAREAEQADDITMLAMKYKGE